MQRVENTAFFITKKAEKLVKMYLWAALILFIVSAVFLLTN
ncbi:MAG: hypothetical protein ABIF17_00535 [Patescibacteria group bacterium]